MQHLVDNGIRGRYHHRIPYTRWLGFDHDTSCQYPVVPLDQYPKIRGWTDESIDHLKMETSLLTPQALAMLQSWLFFGLLEIILDRHISTKDFTVQRDQGSMVDTSKLRTLLADYLGFLRWGCQPENHTPLRRHMRIKYDSLQLSQDWNEILLDAHERCVPSSGDALNHVLRLTTICADTLDHTNFWVDPELRNANNLKWVLSSEHEKDLIHRLRVAGWCPSVYDQLRSLCFCVLEMATIFGPSDLPFQSLVHDKCLREECYLENVDVRIWKPKHMLEDCGCKNVQAPIEQLIDVLKGDNFGLLDIDILLDREDQSRDLLVTHKAGMKYVTFSHVWSQGLGSVAEDGLPRCQLYRLENCISEYWKDCNENTPETPRLFWIDALCIPRDKSARSRAISQMANIYKNAAATLVLDNALQAIKHENGVFKRFSSVQDKLLIQIAASDWNRRLWTFQEGALSRNLYLMLCDGPLSATKFWRSMRGPVGIQADWLMGPQAHTLYQSLLPILVPMQKSFRIGTISNALKQRSSSDPSDETLVIASLLELDVRPFVVLNDEERICLLLKSVKKFPSNVIYSRQNRMDVEGYRWAPRTFLRLDSHVKTIMDVRHEAATATVTESGLKGQFLIAMFPAPATINRGPYCFLNESDDILYKFAIRSKGWEKFKNPQSFKCAAIALEWLPTGQGNYVDAIGLSIIGPMSSGDAVFRYQAYLGVMQVDHNDQVPGREVLLVKHISEMTATIS